MNTDGKKAKILEVHWFFECENHLDAASKLKNLADTIKAASVPDKQGKIQTGTDCGCDAMRNRKTWFIYPRTIRVNPCPSVV
jgi:hypothetical protein